MLGQERAKSAIHRRFNIFPLSVADVGTDIRKGVVGMGIGGDSVELGRGKEKKHGRGRVKKAVGEV